MTIGWRVLWLVAAVAIRISLLTAAAAPESVTASLMLNRSEMKAVPRPIASPSRTSSMSSAGDWGAPARRVEAQLGHALSHRLILSGGRSAAGKYRGRPADREEVHVSSSRAPGGASPRTGASGTGPPR